MFTIATTAQELGMAAYDLIIFLDLGPGIDPNAEISEDHHDTIRDMITYDREHNTPAETYED